VRQVISPNRRYSAELYDSNASTHVAPCADSLTTTCEQATHSPVRSRRRSPGQSGRFQRRSL